MRRPKNLVESFVQREEKKSTKMVSGDDKRFYVFRMLSYSSNSKSFQTNVLALMGTGEKKQRSKTNLSRNKLTRKITRRAFFVNVPSNTRTHNVRKFITRKRKIQMDFSEKGKEREKRETGIRI